MPEQIRVQTGGAQTNQTCAPLATEDTARPVEGVANRIGHNPATSRQSLPQGDAHQRGVKRRLRVGTGRVPRYSIDGSGTIARPPRPFSRGRRTGRGDGIASFTRRFLLPTPLRRMTTPVTRTTRASSLRDRGFWGSRRWRFPTGCPQRLTTHASSLRAARPTIHHSRSTTHAFRSTIHDPRDTIR